MSPEPLWPDCADRLVDALQERLKPRRFHHALGVLATAQGLAACHGVPPEPVGWAALLHDLCKRKDRDAIRREAEQLGEPIPPEDVDYPGLWHAWAAAGVARRDHGIEDPQILNAIRHHPTGHPGMGPVAKILILADFLEPTRGLAGRREQLVRARHDLDGVLIEVLRAKCSHLRSRGNAVHPRATAALATLEATVSQEV